MPEPYYDDGSCVIYHGDCREVLPELSADLVLTDPPYGIRKADWDGEFPTDWMPYAADAAPALGLMPGVWNILTCPREIQGTEGQAGMARHLSYRWTLIAHLTNGMTRGLIGFGNYIPCLVYTDDETTAYQQDGDIRRFVVGTEIKPDHPSPKPLRVMSWLVGRLPGESLIDPFMGSGTTLRAAKDLGRKAIGIEIEERYCEIAAQRLGQEVLDLGTAA